MVDIIIGSMAPLGPPPGKTSSGGSMMEAEILNVRDPRHKIVGLTGQDRRKQSRQDPEKGRVLTLLIPDGTVLPKDLDGKKYKVLIRFTKK